MKSMQAREFREQMNSITEVVEVYARGDLKGTWYPKGWQTPQLTIEEIGEAGREAVDAAMHAELLMARDEIIRLKRELAARPATASRPMAITDTTGTRVVQPARQMTDEEARAWLKTLPEQDRAFFASRLGIKTKGKAGSGDSSGD